MFYPIAVGLCIRGQSDCQEQSVMIWYLNMQFFIYYLLTLSLLCNPASS